MSNIDYLQKLHIFEVHPLQIVKTLSAETERMFLFTN